MMAQPRRGHAALRVPGNNTVLLIGGFAGGQFVSENEAYVPWRHRFQSSGTLDTGITAATVMSLNSGGMALVAGGANADGARFNAMATCVPTVQTDKADYAPGTTVVITGSCWQPGGTVNITLTESPDLHGESPITVPPSVVGADGTFTNTAFAPDNNDVGVTFYLTASIALAYAGCPSTLMTRGGAPPPESARRRNNFAATKSRLGDNINSMVSPVESTARYK